MHILADMKQQMKKCTKGFAVVLSLFLCTTLLGGAGKVSDRKYFSIYYDTYHVTVTESLLRGNWYHAAKRDEFTKGQDIYKRVSAIDIEHRTALKAMEQLPEILHAVTKFEKRINTPAYDGHINFDPNSNPKFWVTGARDGYRIDKEALCGQIIQTLKSGKYADIPAPIKTVEHRNEQEVLSNINLRSSYTTRFSESNHSRVNNIALALNAYNGVIIQPGERIGFNQTVGPRTRERGYEEANIIIDGEFVQGVGGGVCQASTTVFNAALLAGMDIVESHNHSLAIGYVPLGRDAMVTSAADLVFENRSGASIYIEAFAEHGIATVKFYGRPVNGITYRPKTSVKTFPVEEEVQGETPADLSLKPNSYEKVVVERGIPAREVLTHIETYKGARLLQKKLIRKSRYKGKPQIVRWEKIEKEEADNGQQAGEKAFLIFG